MLIFPIPIYWIAFLAAPCLALAEREGRWRAAFAWEAIFWVGASDSLLRGFMA